MADKPFQRRLAAVLAADVVGYTRLMEADSDRTVSAWASAREEVIGPRVAEHSGRIVKLTGDGFLVELPTVQDAVRCAIAMQDGLKSSDLDFRMGVSIGDIIDDGEDIHGEGVNVAARLEGIAQPGGIVVSAGVYDQVKNRIEASFEDLGDQSLKNIEAPIRAFRVSVVGSGDASADDPVTSGLEFSPPDRPSVAILPFKSLGCDPDKDYIADGIRFGISASLVQLSGLFLVHSPVMNAYRGKDVSASSVGADLGVRYVLEGAVQQVESQIRVTVQLTDVESNKITFADQYDRILDNIFELQDEITREVIASLNINLVANEIDRVWFGKLSSPEAKEFYYRGASHFYELNKNDNATARELFENLYRVQPDSVVGPSYVSVTHWMDAFFGWTETSAESIEKAATWAQMAMEYKDNNGIGHAVFGYLQLLKGNFDEALANCSTGVQLRTSCPMAHALLGLVHNYCGDAGSAVKSAREALQLERVYPTWLIDILAAAYRDRGEIELSIPAAKESLRLNPQNNEARLILCSTYQLAADHNQAKRVADEIVTSDPEFRLSAYAKSQPYKNPETLRHLIEVLRQAGLP